ncbi:MAG: DUF3634 family protein [Marinilabiliaceae bacterium]|nr:DUF3634 family protein [Marinilabiliaceae bacterium]
MNQLLFIVKIFFFTLLKRPHFVIQIKEGLTSLQSGKVTDHFIKECQEVAKLEKIQYGIIYSVAGAYGKPIIKASNEVSPIGLQRIRNVWTFYS